MKHEYYIAVTIAVVTSFYTLFSMIKIWKNAYLGEHSSKRLKLGGEYFRFIGSVMVLVIPALMMGLGAEFIIRYADTAAEQAYQRTGYIESVKSLAGKGEDK